MEGPASERRWLSLGRSDPRSTQISVRRPKRTGGPPRWLKSEIDFSVGLGPKAWRSDGKEGHIAQTPCCPSNFNRDGKSVKRSETADPDADRTRHD